MKAEEFAVSFFQAVERRDDIIVQQYPLVYLRGSYPFLKLTSKDIVPDERVILILAGLHGEETAGPLTILANINEILDYLSRRKLKILLYPLCNPSGFENGMRYSVDSPEATNNDFLRYELKDHSITRDIGESDEFLRWRWSSDPELKITLPQETRLMHILLREDPLIQVSACIELHQDYLTKNAPPAAYHYAYGDVTRYRHIARLIGTKVPLLKNQEISAGYPDETASKSDGDGFIVRHDGSASDLLYRIGAEHAITVETTGATPLWIAQAVNLDWIFGIADLISENL